MLVEVDVVGADRELGLELRVDVHASSSARILPAVEVDAGPSTWWA
jgi:hypothetical protein